MKTKFKPTIEDLAAQHQRCAPLTVGTTVRVKRDDGSELLSTVIHAPWQLGGGHWVVGVQGISGGYSVMRVTPV